MKFQPIRYDLAGQRFGRLTVEAQDRSNGQLRWSCKCDCGNTIAVAGRSLRIGHTTSCGCFHRENAARTLAMAKTKHGRHGTREHTAWQSMMTRCLNPNNHGYANYGGRGVTVCERWQTFEGFFADMGECPPAMSIDRYPDQNGNYEPGNCRWATRQQQNENRRSCIYLTHDGKTLTVAAWEREIGVSRGTVLARYKAGKSVENCLRPVEAI